ncbi:MAG: ATPase, T2SS/T4P/T4SS family [Candidatus Omnitrophota bacterium]|nr:ATPase, T2SS/T4P/T4SS family [Candidatus Omnitrophota bacterium]
MPSGLKERLIEILIKKRILAEEKLSEALKIQKEKGGSLGDILVALGAVSQNELLAILSQELGIPPISLSKYKIDPKVIKVMPRKIAVNYQMMPISQIGNVLTVAMADPLNVFATDDLKQVTGMEINPIITTRDDIKVAIEHYYGSAATTEIEGLVKETTMETVAGRKEEAETVDLKSLALTTPVVKLTDAIVLEATKARASDILIEPMEESVRIRYRIDGVFTEAQTLPRSVQSSLISRIKVMSNLNIAERRLPQDGRFKAKIQNREVDFRVSTVPTAFGEKIALRVLDKSQATLDLEKLGFEGEPLQELKKASKRPHGMILVCGPAGSGKTTTLYSILKYIDSPQKNFVTVEDPVEFLLPGINQVNVNPNIGLTYAATLRSILRQDPNVIMVGEIRDLETVDIAIKAALTGHLVLSTLHTNTATGVIMRLMNMGVEPFLISSSVILVAAQRLVRKICPRCKEQYEVAKGILEKLKIKSSGEVKFYRGKGCGSCLKTGFKGRVGLIESLTLNAELRELIAKRARENEVYEAARKAGLITLRECGMRKVFDGTTTLEEVLRVTLGEQD